MMRLIILKDCFVFGDTIPSCIQKSKFSTAKTQSKDLLRISFLMNVFINYIFNFSSPHVLFLYFYAIIVKNLSKFT